jgi:hypothetical protein
MDDQTIPAVGVFLCLGSLASLRTLRYYDVGLRSASRAVTPDNYRFLNSQLLPEYFCIMAPRLKAGGNPVGQRIQSTPPVMELCQCSRCRENSGTDPQTQLPVVGRYLAPAELKAHRRQEKLGVVASAALGTLPTAATVSSIPTPPSAAVPFSAQIPSILKAASPSTSQQSEVLTRDHTDDHSSPSDSSANQPVLRALHSIQESIVRLKAIEVSCPLIFCTPPTLDSLPLEREELNNGFPTQISQCCVLDPTVPANSALIGAEQTLDRHVQFVKGHQSSRDVHIRLLCKVILPQLYDTISFFREKRREEWERQRTMAHIAGINAIETSEI